MSLICRHCSESRNTVRLRRIGRVGASMANDYIPRSDRSEAVHVHVEREDKVAKFWLKPARLARSGGFSRKEIGRIQTLLREHEARLIEAWNDYFHG